MKFNGFSSFATFRRRLLLSAFILLTAMATNTVVAQSVSAGYLHSCGVTTQGIAYCWGFNEDGQLGNGTNTASTVPVPVSGDHTFQSVSAGYWDSCGLTTEGEVYCWGFKGRESFRVGPSAYYSVSVGTSHSCGVNKFPYDKVVYCWGKERVLPQPVMSERTFESVSTGHKHSCGLTSVGTVYCWRVEVYEAGGFPRFEEAVLLGGGLTFQSVSAGNGHNCGVTTDGAAYCWGANASGQLGNGTNTDSTVPVLVSGGLTFQSVSAGAMHSCGVTTDGVAYCWGANHENQLGNATNTDSRVPVRVFGGHTFRSVSAGWYHSCGVTTEGVAYCWGANRFPWDLVESMAEAAGQLGNGTDTSSSVPVRVKGDLTF